MSGELVAFVRTCLDDDERVAREADPGPWEVGSTFGARDNRVYVREAGDPGIDTIGTCIIAGQVANKTRFRENAVHIARWDPARVLAEVEAKRRILDDHEPLANGACNRCGDYGGTEHQQWPCTTIRALAQPYAGRDGWREEWRLDGA